MLAACRGCCSCCAARRASDSRVSCMPTTLPGPTRHPKLPHHDPNNPRHHKKGGGTARARPALTSLPLQVFVYFGGWWSALFFWPLSLAVAVYKGSVLPYPEGRFGAEFAFLWLWLLVEPPRLLLASRGNKAERAAPLVAALLLGVPVAALYAYGLRFQTFV